MGQYRLELEFNWQLGLSIGKGWGKSMFISIPFIQINIGLEKHAKGYMLFGTFIK